LIHRLGDIFSHSHLSGDGKMYGRDGYTTEHNFATEPDGSQNGLRPDMIYERPNLYKTYVSVLGSVMQEKFGNGNKVSLIGIINYDVAKLKGDSEFTVQFARGLYKIQNFTAHTEHLENTRKYLDSKGIKYTKKEDYVKDDGGRDIYTGITFTIIK
jgi:hypothetical protein